MLHTISYKTEVVFNFSYIIIILIAYKDERFKKENNATAYKLSVEKIISNIFEIIKTRVLHNKNDVIFRHQIETKKMKLYLSSNYSKHIQRLFSFYQPFNRVCFISRQWHRVAKGFWHGRFMWNRQRKFMTKKKYLLTFQHYALFFFISVDRPSWGGGWSPSWYIFIFTRVSTSKRGMHPPPPAIYAPVLF